jgi:hypothetical protein
MRTDAHLTSVLAVCLTFAGITANAHAAAIDGGVQWAFSGTVISVPSSLNTSGCCDLAYSVGQIVTGSIVLTEAPAPPMTIGSVQLDVPGAAQEVFAEVNRRGRTELGAAQTRFPCSTSSATAARAFFA